MYLYNTFIYIYIYIHILKKSISRFNSIQLNLIYTYYLGYIIN